MSNSLRELLQATLAEKQVAPKGVSRRKFLAGVSAGSLVLMGKFTHAQQTLVDSANLDPNSFSPDFFVAVAPSGSVTCVVHRSEMGTGIRTSLPRVLADELEADWNRVEIQQARGDKRLGDQNTDGSNSIRFFFDRMRTAGAIARTMLERAAAQKLGIDAEKCFGKDHAVHVRGTDQSIPYGDLVSVAKTLDPPKEDELKFKPRSEWKFIGKDAPIADMDDILTGKAIFGIDARLPGQLFAVVARPPVVGGKVKSFDGSEARQVPGVVEIVELERFEDAPLFQPLGGVAVLATNTWAALKGREALDIEWDDGENASYDTDVFATQLADATRRPGEVMRKVGDGAGPLDGAEKSFAADYSVPHLAHAPMEPTCAVADVKTNAAGKVTYCHVLAATQNPQAVQQAVAPPMGIPEDDVLVNVTLLGAGFGRKSKPDYCVEAAMLSRKMQRPVHITWTREDDLLHDYYHAISAVHCEAALDDAGMPTTWLQRIAYPTISSTFQLGADQPAAWEAEMGHTDLPFAVPNIQLEAGKAKAHTRIGWLRSVCHIQQNFAVSSFADELAQFSNRDPLEYLLALLGEDRIMDLKAAGLGNRGASEKDYPFDIGRLKSVLRRSAEMANWSDGRKMPTGRGLGIACARSFLGYTGHVVEVDVEKDGTLRIPNVWVALDAGTIVSPDRVVSQVEGAAIMGTSQVRYGKITFKEGVPQETNFDSYQVAKMEDSPRHIHVEVVDSTAAPAGVGETGVPSFAPALCNAVFQATGKRIRSLPLADHDLSWS